MSTAAPSIATRLGRALLLWSLAWGLAAGGAVWLAAASEVGELLDETLAASAPLLAAAARLQAEAPPTPHAAAPASDEFAWQWVDAAGRVQARSPRAPAEAWQPVPRPGFSSTGGWRLYGLATGADGGMFYAAQSTEERGEARFEVGLAAVLAALAVGGLGHLWLRDRVRAELAPLGALSQRLADWPADGRGAGLGPAERAELAPVHQALDGLAARLADRIATERAFAAHAAHALRTPLAGIDAQLAVAAREAARGAARDASPDAAADAGPALAERLGRVRQAAARLQSVVTALLALFRSSDGVGAPDRRRVALATLVARLAPPGLAIDCADDAVVDADPDLLAAALGNLLDNAVRHGATRVSLAAGDGGRSLRLVDDGPGIDEARRRAIATALGAGQAAPSSDGGGLGLLLAARVARAHGGRLELPPGDAGFRVVLWLSDAARPASDPSATAPTETRTA